ncbi:hypothetical protein EYW49_18485 [Siculibacillus lacustris]|uniref:Uncharacterized protein n=1 Tax=Siculibacillus lacustris TaxID=1549641 RepID=A0A4Q9VJ67_9HYPH|nr:hypothetical protein [Siculibacillus lacustris]TBW34427.1 hypothetical protein EYW49_18485 [Siculibacillus lacustris]
MTRGARSDASADRFRPEALAAANINPVTRLATDYLNHFNNVVMLLELVPDMPDCVEEVADWAPVAYDDYFRGSHFRERDLAIAAFHAADPEVRAVFDATVTHLDCAMAEAIDLAVQHDPTDPEIAFRIRSFVKDRLKPLISAASGIVNASPHLLSPQPDSGSDEQAAVDELFP